MAAFSTGSEGANFYLTYNRYDQTAAISSTNDPSNPGYPFALGTQMVGTDGSRWIFADTATTLAQYTLVAINSSFRAVAVGGTGAFTAQPEGLAVQIGSYQGTTSMTTGQAGWFVIQGNATLLVASAGISVPLYTLDTTGALTGATNTTSHYQISGVTCVVTASGSTASATAVVMNSVSVRKPLAGS